MEGRQPRAMQGVWMQQRVGEQLKLPNRSAGPQGHSLDAAGQNHLTFSARTMSASRPCRSGQVTCAAKRQRTSAAQVATALHSLTCGSSRACTAHQQNHASLKQPISALWATNMHAAQQPTFTNRMAPSSSSTTTPASAAGSSSGASGSSGCSWLPSPLCCCCCCCCCCACSGSRAAAAGDDGCGSGPASWASLRTARFGAGRASGIGTLEMQQQVGVRFQLKIPPTCKPSMLLLAQV